jgi:hypothetical protein
VRFLPIADITASQLSAAAAADAKKKSDMAREISRPVKCILVAAGGLTTMTSFKQPSFQERVGQAADAKEKALEQLRLRPEPDEKMVAQRKAAGEQRQAAQVEKANAKKAAAETAAEAAAESKAKAAAKAAAPVPTEAERKAARDVRYAARKARK